MTVQTQTSTQQSADESRPSDASDSPVPPDDDHESKRKSVEDKLDEALKESFPASDPIAITLGDR